MLSKFNTNNFRQQSEIITPKTRTTSRFKSQTRMGKKMKFPFLFKATQTATSAAAPWPWPACVNNPKTLSFRVNTDTSIYKTMNSAYLDNKSTTEFAETPESLFSIRESIEHREIISSVTEICEEGKNDETAVIRGKRSDRLFFEPGETSSILEEAKAYGFPFKEGAKIMAMDSSDPFMDFRESMEEMVEAHGLKSWESLEELLTCYLRVNGKSNHGYIVGAFVDLLINLALASASSNECPTSPIDERCCSSSSTTQYSFTSPLSFSYSGTYSSSSPCLSSLENEDEIVVQKNVSSCSSGV